jgi:hypothetical protein
MEGTYSLHQRYWPARVAGHASRAMHCDRPAAPASVIHDVPVEHVNPAADLARCSLKRISPQASRVIFKIVKDRGWRGQSAGPGARQSRQVSPRGISGGLGLLRPSLAPVSCRLAGW